jgi:pimeloyl-ACP methyl ester carboxylesterase
VKLPHDDLGSGPAIVLLHAGVADRSMWSEHLEPLAAAGHRVVAVDLPGFGEASVPPGPQAPWNDVLETMAALRIDQAALVGNSFGGAVALRIALLAPAAVSSLVLISAPSPDLEPSPELEAVWEAESAALDRGDIEAAVEAVVNAWVLPDAPPALRARVAETQRRALELQAVAPPVSEAPDPLERDPAATARIDVPTLVAAGERDVPDFRAGAERLAQALPHARRELIAGAGHLAPLETPERFRELLLAFLP